jgi:hypothetical protein
MDIFFWDRNYPIFESRVPEIHYLARDLSSTKGVLRWRAEHYRKKNDSQKDAAYKVHER